MIGRQDPSRFFRAIKPALTIFCLLAIISVLTTGIISCSQPIDPISEIRLVALAPTIASTNSQTPITVSLQDQGAPVQTNVDIELINKQHPNQRTRQTSMVNGTRIVTLNTPPTPGDYDLRVSGVDPRGYTFDVRKTIQLRDTSFLILQTDKPTYQPGHTIKMRAIVMNQELRPVPAEVTFTVTDAQDASVHKQTVPTGPYGIASSAIPISPEPRTGAWTATATTSHAFDEREIIVDHYVLPRYEVILEPNNPRANSGEPVTGKIITRYTHGLAARGTLTITPLYRETGQPDWIQGSDQTHHTQGQAEYSFNTAKDWTGNVQVRVTFQENPHDPGSTEHHIHTVTTPQTNIEIIPVSSTVKPGLPFWITILYPDWKDTEPEPQITFSAEYVDTALSLNTLIKEQRANPQQGRALVVVEIPRDAASITITVKDQTDTETQLHIPASHSTSGNYIQLEHTNPGPKDPGDLATFRVHATDTPAQTFWQISARGAITAAGLTHNDTFETEVLTIMSPQARVLAYTITQDGELLTSHVDIDISTAYPLGVTITAAPKNPRPGDNMNISVKTQGPSLVSISGTDRATHILAGRKFTLQDILTTLQLPGNTKWNSQASRTQLKERERWSQNPGTSQLLEHSRTLVITNAPEQQGRTLLNRRNTTPKTPGDTWPYRVNKAMSSILYTVLDWFFYDARIEPAGGASLSGSSQDDRSGPAAWTPPEIPVRSGEATAADRVRSLFPESWLWELDYTDAQGNLTLQAAAPDSITSWDLRTIAMSKDHGLGIAETSFPVIQPLYLKADLPPSTIRNETIPLSVTAYNYTNTPQDVRVLISAPPESGLKATQEKTVFLDHQANASVTFHITPSQIGPMALRIEARGETHSDAMDITTKVRAEGTPVFNIHNETIKPGESKVLKASLEGTPVPDTLRVWAQVTGERMSKPMAYLGNLLRTPYGCGEQNMSAVGPNAQILIYLDNQPNPSKQVIQHATRLMQHGYQRQLTYQRTDGSFSSFGNKDPHGSIWLTAYTIKTFAQSSPYIHIDPNVMRRAITWIQHKQDTNGRFTLNPRTVPNQELINSDLSLTAYVTLALMEVQENLVPDLTILRSIQFIEQNLGAHSTSYDRAAAALALTQARSDHAQKAIELLMENAQRPEEKSLRWRTGSNTVEPTAYSAMALSQAGYLNDSQAALHSLSKAQNPWGGFQDTHATAVAIEAIRKVSTNRQSRPYLTTVKLEAPQWSETFTITQENRDELLLSHPPSGTKQITATVEGTDPVHVNLVTQYNLLPQKPQAEDQMELVINLSTDTIDLGDTTTLTAELKYANTAPDQAGMITIEIEAPTGAHPTPESLRALVENNPRVMRADHEDIRTAIYLDWLGPGETISLSYELTGTRAVEGRQSNAQAYAYYRPNISTSANVPALSIQQPTSN